MNWIIYTCTFVLQEFDSNVKADKLFRFKIGGGKVIKVKYSVHLEGYLPVHVINTLLCNL